MNISPPFFKEACLPVGRGVFASFPSSQAKTGWYSCSYSQNNSYLFLVFIIIVYEAQQKPADHTFRAVMCR